MQRLCATSMVVAVIIASTAGAAATARADAPPAGALSQLPGPAACLATTNSDAPPDAGCTLLRTSATSRSCSNCLGNAVISPEGLDLYLVDQGSNTLVHMRRDPATGQLAQALGTGGCISGSGRNGCARARGIANGKRRKKGQPGLPALRGVAISPDGRNVYVSASGRTDAVLAFGRDASTGALQQLSGRSGCIGVGISACATARAMQFNNRLLISPDGANVYVEMSRSPGQLAVLRRAGDGSLHQLAGKAGCLSGSKKSGCTKLGNPTEDTLALSPDGKQAYIASGEANDISIYSRRPGTGALRLQRSCIAYQDTKPCGPTDTGQFISLRMSPDGSSLYLVEGVDDLVVGYARDPSTGSLTKLPAPFGCGRSTPCPDGLAVAESIAFTPDSQTAYYILATGNGSGGGVILYHHGADGSLTPFAAPFACVAAVATTCQPAPNLRVNEPSMVISPDGRNAYPVGQETITAFAIAGPSGP